MNQKLPDQTYYEILEVSPVAPQHEIQRAYQRAKQTYSPDSPALYTMFTEDEARDLLSLIEEAFSVLGNHSKREVYDQQLLRQKAHVKGSEALPDFDLSENEEEKMSKENAKKSAAKGNKQTQLPDGFARTRFSVYEVQPQLEEEIKGCQCFEGSVLKKIRLYKNINLDQLSNETRISRTYLAAVEANDYSALPAPVFVRGFVVQMARALGLREQQVASSYMETYKKGGG